MLVFKEPAPLLTPIPRGTATAIVFVATYILLVRAITSVDVVVFEVTGAEMRGWLAFGGRKSNPLDHDERFPSCYSPLPGFT